MMLYLQNYLVAKQWGCAQRCDKNGDKAVCSCNNGYQLGSDGRACTSKLSIPFYFIIFSGWFQR